MRTNIRFILAAVGLLVVWALVVAGVRVGSMAGVIDGLQQELDAERSQSGGAETDPPPIVDSSARFRFPIAESDYLQLTSPYGHRISPLLRVQRYHTGVDIAATWRAQVVAVADGVIVEHWPPPDGYFRGHRIYGGMVTVEHEGGWRSVYAHLSWTTVHTGDRVGSGEVIGRVGSTGMSDGEHLHLELLEPSGREVNPLIYLEAIGVEGVDS